ncbi:MAG: hypothetical protein HYT28_01730 [Parcubacteria group bacterium]|nr:hypothetical protein [Parcubacteria group bacterium]
MHSCAFCDKKVFEEQLVAEYEQFYIIATLGQITDGGYILIFPKRHVPCMSALNHKEMVQLVIILGGAEHIITGTYGLPAIFEHGIVGQTVPHAHLHLAPVRFDLTDTIDQDFPQTQKKSFDILLTGIPRQSQNALQPYLLWRPPNENAMAEMWMNPQKVPVQYLRTLLADAAGRPERGNWREMDSKLDKRLWSETVKNLRARFL